MRQMVRASSVCWHRDIYRSENGVARQKVDLRGEIQSLTSFQFAYTRDTREASNHWKKLDPLCLSDLVQPARVPTATPRARGPSQPRAEPGSVESRSRHPLSREA